ncbi:MAG: efflux RND transporter permease subunit [Magnetospirillum sp.]
MDALTTLFYRNARLTWLAIGLILVAGLSAFSQMPRLEDPLIASRYASIQTDYPGADAEMVDSQVTEKLETYLFEIEEVQEIKSVSRTGFSQIVVILEDEVPIADLDEVWSRVRAKLDDARAVLPDRAGRPFFRKDKPSAHTLVVSFTWALDGPPDRGILTRLAKAFERELSLKPGTERTELFGEAVEEVAVTYDPATLAAAGLTPTAMAKTIADADVKQPAGGVFASDNQLTLDVRGPFDQIEQVRHVSLRRLDDGRMLRVGDIAQVRKSERLPAESMALVEGRSSVLVSALMADGWRTDQWAAGIRHLFADFTRDLPDGIQARILFDQSSYVTSHLGELADNLMVSLVLVIIVVCLTMGWRSGLVVGAILPLALALSVAVLHATGASLHQVSITGLIVAIGILIDNAIVAVDEYDQRRSHGLSKLEAVSGTVKHLTVPLLASSVTTVLAFAPIALFPGPTGEFAGSLGVSVILAVVASLVLSLTIIPALAGTLDRRQQGGPELRGFPHTGIKVEVLAQLYDRVFDWVLRRPVRAALLVSAPAVIGFLLSGQLVQQFFPPTDRDQFQLSVTLRAQATLDETRQVVERVRAILAAEPDIVSDTWVLGAAPPRVYYNVTTATDRIAGAAAAFIDTVSPRATRSLLPRLQEKLRAEIPQAEVLVLPFEQGPLFDAPIEVELYGPDLSVLRDLGDQIRLILAGAERVTYTRATLVGGLPKLSLNVDADTARLTDFGLSDLAATLSAHLDGVTGGSIVENTEELKIRVRADDGFRADMHRISTMPLAEKSSGTGGESPVMVPLDALGTLTLRPALSAVTRYQGEHVNRIQAFLAPYTLPAATLQDFQRRFAAAGLQLPTGYRMSFGGESRESGKSQAGLLAMVGPLVVMMAATVVLAFNSFRMAGVIGLVAVQSMGLALLAVWVGQMPLGFMTILGGMGLVGIAINDSIVVLAALREAPAARRGDPAAIRAAVGSCTRHVLSTTLTTVAGFVPLILWGSSFWQPLAVAIAGGVTGSTLLALIFAPALFVLSVRGRGTPAS